MRISDLVNQVEVVVEPFASIGSIEDELIKNGYLVIKEKKKFIGILTPADALAAGHNLVIDCYKEKPSMDGNEDAEVALKYMLDNGFRVLPVVSANNAYLGCIQVDTIFCQVWKSSKQSIRINWLNIIGDEDLERSKQKFSMELFHNTRNPVQTILSAVDLLRAPAGGLESEMLLKTIEANSRIIDSLVTKLYSVHFEKGEKIVNE
jgi:predicted transcriptional regulator